VARDPDTIQREIEGARTALADTLDELGDRANPKHLVAQGRESVQVRLADPRVKYTLIGIGVILALAILRRLFR
jgi:hypothetical protein